MADGLEFVNPTTSIRKNSSGIGELRYPIDIDKTGRSISQFIKFSLYDRPDANSSNLKTQIYLYMPLSAENPVSVNWDSAPIPVAVSALKNGESATDIAGKYFLGSIQRAAESAAEYAMSASDQSANGTDIVNYLMGKTKNPNIKMLFRGVNFRSFQFQFKFTPKNKQDSMRIYEIIKEFRKCALPDDDGTNFYMDYPGEVDIEYCDASPNGEAGRNKWLNRFKRCVITDLRVNYTGAGFYASMEDGFPAETELTMTFSENVLVLRKDVEDGF